MIKHCVLYSGGFMKRRIFCFTLFLFVFISLLFVKSFKKEEIDYSVSPVKKNNNTLSMMLENDDGVYEYTTSDSWPQKGYSFNAELSKCENGGELSWDDVSKKVYMSGNVSDKCYVYFDKMPLGEICEGQNMATCFKENYTFDSVLYHHDKSLENSAEDNSYRYSGGDFIITQKAIDAGFTFLRDIDSTSNEGVIKFYCNGEKLTLGDNCPLSQSHYYLLGNNTENKYSTYSEVLTKAVELGYAKKDNVNNFVCFGSNDDICSEDNLYRIVGIFGDNVKLVKAYPATRKLLGEDGAYCGYYKNEKFWSLNLSSLYVSDEINYSNYYWNKATGTNKWSESDLNKVNLNKNYVNNIGAVWSDKIETYKWHTKGDTYENLTTNINQVYKNEISNDNSSLYEAKIGLLYVSDYYYGVDMSYWNSPYFERFNVTDWLVFGGEENFITPISNTTEAMATYGGSPIKWNTVNHNLFDVRPAFYLKNTINLLRGLGTIDEPYRIS